jgi:hypothetical protein
MSTAFIEIRDDSQNLIRSFILKLKNKKELSFLTDLLDKLNFEKENIHSKSLSNIILRNQKKINDEKTEKFNDIRYPVNKPDINDFAGIWQDSNITIEEIREKAWKRK